MTIRDVVSASGTFAANNGTSKQKRFSFLYDMDIISIIFWTGNTISFLTFRGGENSKVIELQELKDKDSDGITYKPVVVFSLEDGQDITFISSVGSYPPAFKVGEMDIPMQFNQ